MLKNLKLAEVLALSFLLLVVGGLMVIGWGTIGLNQYNIADRADGKVAFGGTLMIGVGVLMAAAGGFGGWLLMRSVIKQLQVLHAAAANGPSIIRLGRHEVELLGSEISQALQYLQDSFVNIRCEANQIMSSAESLRRSYETFSFSNYGAVRAAESTPLETAVPHRYANVIRPIFGKTMPLSNYQQAPID